MNIEKSVSDAMTEKPVKFIVAGRTFYINPPTLGKMEILSKYFLLLGMDEERWVNEPVKETMRISRDKTDEVCMLMAVATMNKREDLTDDEKIESLAKFFKWNAGPSDFANMILLIFSLSDYQNFSVSIRLTKTFRVNEPKEKRAGRVEK